MNLLAMEADLLAVEVDLLAVEVDLLAVEVGLLAGSTQSPLALGAAEVKTLFFILPLVLDKVTGSQMSLVSPKYCTVDTLV